jgi:citrate synthase
VESVKRYPKGDPRAALVLKTAKGAGNPEAWRLIRQMARAGAELLHSHPNPDFGLLAVARMYGLPDHAPLLLFALGRTVGWIGHAMEQYAAEELIRPRARYTGPPAEAVIATFGIQES